MASTPGTKGPCPHQYRSLHKGAWQMIDFSRTSDRSLF
jgi:hypothetical protein